MNIQTGDLVLMLSPDNKTFLVKIERDKKFHTHRGILDLNDAIGREYGDSIISTLDKKFVLLEPTVEDKMMKVQRLTQIIYPKDASWIITSAGIETGMKVIECGIGSGAFTIKLADVVLPEGVIYAYDRKKEFMDNAMKNIEFAGYAHAVKPRIGDCKDGFKEKGVDAVILDLPFPWEGIPPAADSLRGGGRIASVSPTINQVEKTVECMRENGFVMISTVEILLRYYIIKTGRSRPVDRMVGHTAYITTARKSNCNGFTDTEPDEN